MVTISTFAASPLSFIFTRAITVYLGNFFDTLDKFVSDEWSTQTGKIAPLATKQESGSAAAATCLQTVLFQI